MHVGKKGVFVLLALVVLSAATPAFACLMPSAHSSSCHGTSMRDCSAPVMMQCGDCCSVRPSAPLLPGSAVAIDHAAGSVPSPALTALAIPPVTGNANLLASETQLSSASPGVGSILRI